MEGLKAEVEYLREYNKILQARLDEKIKLIDEAHTWLKEARDERDKAAQTVLDMTEQMREQCEVLEYVQHKASKIFEEMKTSYEHKIEKLQQEVEQLQSELAVEPEESMQLILSDSESMDTYPVTEVMAGDDSDGEEVDMPVFEPAAADDEIIIGHDSDGWPEVEPVVEPAAEPVVEPAAEPVVEPRAVVTWGGITYTPPAPVAMPVVEPAAKPKVTADDVLTKLRKKWATSAGAPSTSAGAPSTSAVLPKRRSPSPAPVRRPKRNVKTKYDSFAGMDPEVIELSSDSSSEDDGDDYDEVEEQENLYIKIVTYKKGGKTVKQDMLKLGHMYDQWVREHGKGVAEEMYWARVNQFAE